MSYYLETDTITPAQHGAKTCKTCGKVKSSSEFYVVNKSGTLRTDCKMCRNAYNQAYYRRIHPIADNDRVAVRKYATREKKHELAQGQAKTKLCSSCMTEKPVSEFHRHSRSPDGLNYKCKTCRSEEHQRKRGIPRVYSTNATRHQSYYL